MYWNKLTKDPHLVCTGYWLIYGLDNRSLQKRVWTKEPRWRQLYSWSIPSSCCCRIGIQACNFLLSYVCHWQVHTYWLILVKMPNWTSKARCYVLGNYLVHTTWQIAVLSSIKACITKRRGSGIDIAVWLKCDGTLQKWSKSKEAMRKDCWQSVIWDSIHVSGHSQ